jgi:ketosteroid isomerase-like protein
MSSAAQSPQVSALDTELNQSILSGKVMEAFEKFYAHDCVMQENSEAPRVGKDVNREFEKAFMDSVQEFHGASLLGSAVNGDRTYSEWEYDITFKGGKRMKMNQVAVRRWKNGQVAHERFYYSKG